MLIITHYIPYKMLISLLLLFFSGANHVSSERSEMTFYRKKGWRSTSSVLATIEAQSETDCLGECLNNEECLSFNAVAKQSSPKVPVPVVCELLSLNKCGVILENKPGVSLFFSSNKCEFRLFLYARPTWCLGVSNSSKKLIVTTKTPCKVFHVTDDHRLMVEDKCFKKDTSGVMFTDNCNSPLKVSFHGSEKNMKIMKKKTLKATLCFEVNDQQISRSTELVVYLSDCKSGDLAKTSFVLVPYME